MTSRIEEFEALLTVDANLVTMGLTDELRRAVAALLAFAGASMPLPVWTTVEELDASPVGTLVEDPLDGIYENWGARGWHGVNWDGQATSADLRLPVRVRYLP